MSTVSSKQTGKAADVGSTAHRKPAGTINNSPLAEGLLKAFDDLFGLPPGPARFAVTAGGRRLSVEMTSGYTHAQVFAPPDQTVICFEPMTAPVNALRSHDALRTVPPGETARATFAIAIEQP